MDRSPGAWLQQLAGPPSIQHLSPLWPGCASKPPAERRDVRLNCDSYRLTCYKEPQLDRQSHAVGQTNVESRPLLLDWRVTHEPQAGTTGTDIRYNSMLLYRTTRRHVETISCRGANRDKRNKQSEKTTTNAPTRDTKTSSYVYIPVCISTVAAAVQRTRKTARKLETGRRVQHTDSVHWRYLHSKQRNRSCGKRWLVYSNYSDHRELFKIKKITDLIHGFIFSR